MSSNDWEQRKLGDLVDRVTRKNQDLVSELPLTISAQYGLIDQNEFFDKRVASKDVSGYYLIENGESSLIIKALQQMLLGELLKGWIVMKMAYYQRFISYLGWDMDVYEDLLRA